MEIRQRCTLYLSSRDYELVLKGLTRGNMVIRTHQGHIPVADGSYVGHEVMPRHHALHVDVGVVPQCQDVLVQLLSSAGEGRDVNNSSQRAKSCYVFGKSYLNSK